MIDEVAKKLAGIATDGVGKLGMHSSNDFVKTVGISVALGGKFGIHGAIIGGILGAVTSVAARAIDEANLQTLREIEERQRQKQELIDRALADAYAKLEKEDYSGAVNSFGEAIALKPDAKSYFWRGCAYYHLKEYHTAIDDYTKVIQIHPKLAAAYHIRGLSFYALGNNGRAKSEFKIASHLYYAQGEKRHHQEMQQYIKALTPIGIQIFQKFIWILTLSALVIPPTYFAMQYISNRHKYELIIIQAQKREANIPKSLTSKSKYELLTVKSQLRENILNLQTIDISSDLYWKAQREIRNLKEIEDRINSLPNIYPSNAISNYIDVCTKGGVTKEFCTCFIIEAQKFYTLDELVEINKMISMGMKNPEGINLLLNKCKN